MTDSLATLRALRTALANAADADIVRIVSIVDRLDDRDEADAILAPIRARLRPLRLERPLKITRLLAMPLDTILVDAAQWRPNAASVPRSAIRPLCSVVLERAGGAMQAALAMIEGATTHNTGVILEAGAVLWPAAAAALRDAREPPPGWKTAGLPAACFAPLASGVGICLDAAIRLHDLCDPTAGLPQVDQALSTLLRQAARVGPSAWSMLLTVMFCALPHAQAPRDAALSQGAVAALRPAADAALNQVWNWVECAAIGAPLDLHEAALSLRQRGAVLAALAAVKAQRARAMALQADLRDAYARYLADAARERLVGGLSALRERPDDAAMARFETEARGLRHVELEIRALGGSPVAAAALHEAALAIAGLTTLGMVDRARLVEILDQPEAAIKVLTAA